MSILKDVNLASKAGFLRDCASVFAGCQTESGGIQTRRLRWRSESRPKPAGDYYIGRRYF